MDIQLASLMGRKNFLFDFDGVITDSEGYVFRILQQMIKDHYGVSVDDGDIWMTIGCSDEKVAEYIAAKYNIEYTVSIARELRKGYPDYYTEYEGLKPYPYLPELLAKLKDHGRKIAIVSSTDRYHLESAISRMGLSIYLDAIVSGSDVRNKKPFPEPYLRGLEVLSANTCDSVAIEDSPTGIESAIAAGLECIGFSGSDVRQDIGKASIIVSSYKAMIEAL